MSSTTPNGRKRSRQGAAGRAEGGTLVAKLPSGSTATSVASSVATIVSETRLAPSNGARWTQTTRPSALIDAPVTVPATGSVAGMRGSAATSARSGGEVIAEPANQPDTGTAEAL